MPTCFAPTSAPLFVHCPAHRAGTVTGPPIVPAARRPPAGRRSPSCADRGHQARRVRAVTLAAAAAVDRRHPGRRGVPLAADAAPVAAHAHAPDLPGGLDGAAAPAGAGPPRRRVRHRPTLRLPQRRRGRRRQPPARGVPAATPPSCVASAPSERRPPAPPKQRLLWLGQAPAHDRPQRGGRRGTPAVAPPIHTACWGAAAAAAATAGGARAPAGGSGHRRGTSAGPTPRVAQRATSFPSEETRASPLEGAPPAGCTALCTTPSFLE